jgi:bifunctional UDP-N-acetylglucosamine pyrophosphorylase/glucosamine-1-phosphate N-acetyltransferase
VPLSVVVLAAGQGKRMRSGLPKVLQPLAGRPLLGHVIDLARTLEPDGIHIVYGHGGDAVRAAFPDADLHWAEQAEQLGTGHALRQALPQIEPGHRVLVLCGDVPLTRPETLQGLIGAAADTDLAVLTAKLDDPTGYGRIVRAGDAGNVARIVEQKDASPEQLVITEVNTGIVTGRAGAMARWLDQLSNDNAQGEYYLTDIIELAASDGVAVVGHSLPDLDEAMGINDKVQLAAAERLYQRRQATQAMRDGATIADPDRIDIRGSLSVGSDVFIDVNTVFEGDVELGDGCHIGPNCVVRDAKLGAGTQVRENCVIEASSTGARCVIGPFARIRPETELDDEVKIGNFVETKKASIAKGSKVNHLSYIGDTAIGTNVNVGAGTITCNYDGANKHKTTIGNDVFVGSGVNLVAPVVIGDGATIGAGSTINKDAAPGELTIARTRQTSISGWQRPKKSKG